MATKPNVDSIIDEALLAAHEASIKAEGEFINWYPCGFAWVTIKPAHSKLAKRLIERDIGHKGYDVGVSVWNPSRHHTQNMDIKYAGAIAFAEVLQKYGVKAVADCRMD